MKLYNIISMMVDCTVYMYVGPAPIYASVVCIGIGLLTTINIVWCFTNDCEWEKYLHSKFLWSTLIVY